MVLPYHGSKCFQIWYYLQKLIKLGLVHNLGKEMALVQDEITIMASQDVTPEQAERFEVECGFCSKLITVRSLEAHIMAFHSKEY
jgi:hypothetical protein